MDLVLVPIKLRLSALVGFKLWLPFVGDIRKVVFKVNLWEYSTPAIEKRMIDASTKEDDETPPEFTKVVKTSVSNRVLNSLFWDAKSCRLCFRFCSF